MNTEECLKKIERYLLRSDVGVLVVDVQNSADLSDIVSHFNVTENTFIPAAKFCRHDELPCMDTLFDTIAREQKPVFLTELSPFLKLRGEQAVKRELANLLATTIAGHVVVLTFQCRAFLNFPDPRLSGRICIVDGTEDEHINIVFTSDGLSMSDKTDVAPGINAFANQVETKRASTVYVYTKKEKKTFPNSLYMISEMKNAYDILVFIDRATSTLDRSLGTEAEWKYALKNINKLGSWASLISAEFGNTKTLDLVVSGYSNFSAEKQWLCFIGLKLFGAKNNLSLDTAASRATDTAELIRHVYRDILEVEPTSSTFNDYYSARKVLLNAFGNPIDDVTDFCTIVMSKEKDALCYLTDNTQRERETIFHLLDKYGLEFTRIALSEILKSVFPDLYAYLLPFRFKNDLLDDYFQTYKYEKIINKLLPEFQAIVEEQAKKRDYNHILAPRSALVEKIDKNGAQLFFIDALGVEYLGFIMSLCRDRRMMANVHVCRCELPSITSRNKEFIDAFTMSGHKTISIKDIDDIKHHGQDDDNYQSVKAPIYLAEELSIIRSIIDKIKVKLANGEIEKAVIIADHGSSRLAVIHETENRWKMASSGIYSGRCCPKSELDVQPDFATDAGDFWSLANYDRFRGGRKANFEVHGGATLEEVTVPIIEISYTAESIEIKLMPPNATASFVGIPEILVSYRKKAAIKLFATRTLHDVRIRVNNESYDATPIDNNFYLVEMPNLKRAKQYSVDVYSCENLVASNLPLIVKSESSGVRDIL